MTENAVFMYLGTHTNVCIHTLTYICICEVVCMCVYKNTIKENKAINLKERMGVLEKAWREGKEEGNDYIISKIKTII